MLVVAQSVRAPGCGPGGRGFESRLPAHFSFLNYYVYILHCSVTGKSYVGHTDHLILRYYRHRDGKSRWTRQMKRPVVVHWEQFQSRADAIKREKYYKSGSGFRVRSEIIDSGVKYFPDYF